MHSDSTILATGRFLHKNKLKPYLQTGADFFLAQGQEQLGEEYARYLAQYFPHSKRLVVPERGHSWHKEWFSTFAPAQRIQTESRRKNLLNFFLPDRQYKLFETGDGLPKKEFAKRGWLPLSLYLTPLVVIGLEPDWLDATTILQPGGLIGNSNLYFGQEWQNK